MVLRGLSVPGQVRPASRAPLLICRGTRKAQRNAYDPRIGERHQNGIKSLCLETLNEGRDPLECL